MTKTTRDVLQENIVEDIELYKQIHHDFNHLMKSIEEDYESNLSFDQFWIKVLNNFDGIDDDFEFMTKKEYISRIYKSLIKLSFEELREKESKKYFEKILNEIKIDLK